MRAGTEFPRLLPQPIENRSRALSVGVGRLRYGARISTITGSKPIASFSPGGWFSPARL